MWQLIMNKRQWLKGFTLIEMLLVLVIMSFIVLAIIGYSEQRSDALRRDRAILQIQQIQNAAIAYFIGNSSWPATMTDLQNAGYLPRNITIVNPWGNQYYMRADNTTGTFAVCTAVVGGNTNEESTALATILVGRLPLTQISSQSAATNCSPAMTVATSCADPTCTILSVINVPGQNLNNARSVNFAGVYHNGACVPVPACPGATTGPNVMRPAIIVAPVSVSGNYDSNSRIYPLSSFTASVTDVPSSTPRDCDNGAPTPCDIGTGIASPTNLYWRVCLQVITSSGAVTSATNPSWGSQATVMAITRCVPNNEAYGSSFSVFNNN